MGNFDHLTASDVFYGVGAWVGYQNVTRRAGHRDCFHAEIVVNFSDGGWGTYEADENTPIMAINAAVGVARADILERYEKGQPLAAFETLVVKDQ